MKAIEQFFPVVLFITLVAQGGSIFFNGLGNVLMCAIIQTKAVEHYAPLVLFTMLYKVLILWKKSKSVAIQMKANEQYFSVVVSIS